MPEISSNLFQFLTLGLLIVLVVVLLLLLNTITKLRSELGQGASGSADAWSGGGAQTHSTPAPAPTPAAGSSHSAWTDPSWGSSQAAGQGIGQQGAPTGIGYSEPAAGTSAYAQPQASQPNYEQTAYTPIGSGEASPQGAPSESFPEDQPFERQGRWWFKRGDELLVYDEATGQWAPAPAGSLSGSGGGAPAASEPQSLSDSGPGGGEGSQTGEAFWKCASCGAVNGMTAASCRMCFAARP
jgi:hypothetical protein